MKKTTAILVCFLISIGSVLAQHDYESGVILLKLKNPDVVSLSGTTVVNGNPELQSILNEYGISNSYMLPYAGPNAYGWYHIDFPEDAPLRKIMEALKECGDIAAVNLNHRAYITEVPNDTYWSDQWAMQKIQMENAWEIVKPDNQILVGILDSGIDRDHDDLSDNIWTNPDEIPSNGQDDDDNGYIDDTWGWNFVAADCGQDANDPMDQPADTVNDFHGTRAAGVVAARTYNGVGVAGVAGGWQGQTGVRLIALKVFGMHHQTGQVAGHHETAGSGLAYLSQLAFNSEQTFIANMSFAFYVHDNSLLYLKDQVDDAEEAGVIMVAAAGNTKMDSEWEEDACTKLPAPARWDYVLAIGASVDGATLDDEEKADYSLYDYQEKKLLAVAPVVGSSMNVYTTYMYDGYTNTFEGTSAACPQVVGLVSLLLSLNDSSWDTKIRHIIKQTSEKINSDEYTYTGYPSRADEVGYGRINAYQAVNMALAFDNKSPNLSPTNYNNQRILARSKNNSNVLYEVFWSGTQYNWEIFFRKSTNNGATWGYPARLSEGNEYNQFPCISITDEGTYDGIHVVWQHKKDNDKYQVKYRESTNSGVTWQDAIVLPDADDIVKGGGRGPMPVISYSEYNGNYRLIVVFATTSGFRWRYRNEGSSWVTPSNGGLLGPPSGPSTNHSWFPSIMGEQQKVALTCDFRYTYGVYSYVYDHFTGWLPAVSVRNGAFTTTHDRQSQVAVYQDKMLATWMAVYTHDSRYRILFREGDLDDNTWSSQYHEFAPLGTNKHAYCPSITHYDHATYDIAITYRSSDVWVGVYKYNGSTWSSTQVATDANYPNISHEGNTSQMPWMMYMDVSSSPYQITFNSSDLNKAGPASEMKYHRRITVSDTTHRTGLSLEIGEIEAVTVTGETVPVSFVSVPDTMLNMNLSNYMDYMKTEAVNLPADVQQLRFYAEVFTTAPSDTGEAKPPTKFKDFDVAFSFKDAGSGSSYSVNRNFSDGNGWINSKEVISLNAAALAGRSVVLQPVISPVNISEEDIGFSLGHIWLEQEGGEAPKPLAASSETLMPDRFMLKQNVPNPFNPDTDILYSLEREGRVTVKVFDMLGKEIITLVDEVRPAGHHRVRWNARDANGNPVPSGMYVYRLTSGEHTEQRKMILLK